MGQEWRRQPDETDPQWDAFSDYCRSRQHLADDPEELLDTAGTDPFERREWDARATALDVELIRRRALNAAEAASQAAARVITTAAAGVLFVSDYGIDTDDQSPDNRDTDDLPSLAASLEAGCRIMASALAIAETANPEGAPPPTERVTPQRRRRTSPAAVGETSPPQPKIGKPRPAGTPQHRRPAVGLTAVDTEPAPEADQGTQNAPPEDPDPASEPATAAEPAPPTPEPEPDPPPPEAEAEPEPAPEPATVLEPDPPPPEAEAEPEPAPEPATVLEPDPPPPEAEAEPEPAPEPATVLEPDPPAEAVDPAPRRSRLKEPTVTERCGQRGGATDHHERGEKNCELCDAYQNRKDGDDRHGAVIVPTY